MEKIKVMIVDDQKLLREGLKTIINFQEDMEVVGLCENGEEAVEKAGALHPDILLMDIRMPVMDGVLATKKIKESYPQMKVIILTTFDDDEYIIKALGYGAEGYLLKDTDGEGLTRAIRDAMAGNLLLPGKVAVKLAHQILKTKGPAPSAEEKELIEPLSKREREVARLLAEGYSNNQISETLYLSEGTVKNYISNIYAKIGISDRSKAVLWLKEHLF